MVGLRHAGIYSQPVSICQAAFVSGRNFPQKLSFAAMTAFSTRLVAAISASGKTQAGICRETGLSTSRMANYVTGKRMPDDRTLEQLAAVLGTDADTLTGSNLNLSMALETVLTTLLRLDGSSDRRAAAIAETAVAALRILKALPEDGDPAQRSQLAAQAAWQSRSDALPRQ